MPGNQMIPKKPETILVIDDDPSATFLEGRCLEEAGFRVITATSTGEATRLIEACGIDLIVLDYEMCEGISGLDFYLGLKSAGFLLPTMMVTGYSQEAVILGALRAGVDDFVTKSLTYIEHLPEAVNRILTKVRLKKALEAAQAQCAHIVKTALDAILMVNAEGRILLFNHAAETMFQCPIAEAINGLITQFFPEWTAELSRREETAKRPNGQSFPVEISVAQFSCEGDMFYTLAIRDITDRKHMEALLKEMALHDALTGLATRRALEHRFSHALTAADRRDHQIALLFMDIDDFKAVNDAYGHQTGDLLLRAIAERLTGAVRKENAVARLGGDEFVVVLESITDVQDVARVAHKIITALSQPYKISGHNLSPTASIGIAIYPEDGRDHEALMSHADAAMYRAKMSGRNRYQFYTAALHDEAVAHLALEKALEGALQRGEFCLHYQPQVDAATLQVCGVEALVRWNPSGKDLVLPPVFLPLMEETQAIIPLDEWVLRTACAQYVTWKALGMAPPLMAVNISRQQFKYGGMVETLARILSETGMPAQYLALEMSENVVMENAESTLDTLRALKKLGVQIVIDDLGRGYSSFAKLGLLLVDRVKLDPSFVREMTIHPDQAIIVKAMIALAHHLNIEVVIKGVETEEQQALVQSLHCDSLQGYIVGAPLVPERFGLERLIPSGLAHTA